MARPGRGGSRRYVLVLIVLTAVTFITLDQRQGDSGPVGTVGRFAHRVVSPVGDAASDVMNPVDDWFDGVVHAGSLKRTNARLRRELAAQKVEAAQGKADRAENGRLNALLKLPWGGDQISGVIARVTDTGAGNYNRLITLSRGSESGIHAGMPVVASGGLVGRVWQAWNGGASVLLLDDPDFGVGVRMVTHRNVDIAKGQAGRSTLLVQLTGPLSPRSRPTRGEIVITSGQDDASQFPPGIPIGRVVSTSVNDDGLAIDTIVAPYVDFSSLEYVRVLQWKPGSPVPAKLRATTTVPTTTTTTTSTTVPGATTTTSTSGTTSTTGP